MRKVVGQSSCPLFRVQVYTDDMYAFGLMVIAPPLLLGIALLTKRWVEGKLIAKGAWALMVAFLVCLVMLEVLVGLIFLATGARYVLEPMARDWHPFLYVNLGLFLTLSWIFGFTGLFILGLFIFAGKGKEHRLKYMYELLAKLRQWLAK